MYYVIHNIMFKIHIEMESLIGVKNCIIVRLSKMDVYCMNWVPLNRRLFDLSVTLGSGGEI